MEKEAQPDLLKVIAKKLNKSTLIVLFGLFTILLVLLISRSGGIRQDLLLTDPAGLNYLTADIVKVKEEGFNEILGQEYRYQILQVKLEDGSEAELRNDIQPGAEDSQRVHEGESVVLSKISTEEGDQYVIADKFRVPSVILIFALFFVLTIIFAGLKGLSSMLGLMFTIYVLIDFVVPRIVNGQDPLLISLIGSAIIAFVSIYMAHGFNKRTTVALAGTMVTIMIAMVLALFFVSVAQLSGTGSEEALLLNVSSTMQINLRGLLLGGMIFGVLGVLDDVTTAQAAAVDEIKKANPKLGFEELYQGGISVGKEHIVSLVNTLVLAYIGSSFPLLLLFSLNQGVPLWITLNSEFIMEEVIRTLVGSTALIFAVPITTVMAAFVFARHTSTGKAEPQYIHKH